MKTHLVEAVSHQFRFLLKGYKDLDFYISEKFFLHSGLFSSIIHCRDILVQDDNEREAIIRIPRFSLIVNNGFSEDELEDILWSIRRQLYFYFHVDVGEANKESPIPLYYQMYVPYTPRNPYRIFIEYDGAEDYPDFTREDALYALRQEHIKVYSNFPEQNGMMVSPSRIFMEDFGTNIESFIVSIYDVAWTDVLVGYLTKIKA